MKLGYRIYAQMKKMGLTQSELAKKSGLSQQIISNYINNKSKPGYDAVITLSKALEVEPTWFFDDNTHTGNIIAFGKVQQGGTLKIGHLSPMEYLPSPVSLDIEIGIAANLYWLIFDKLVACSSNTPKGKIAYGWQNSSENHWIFDIIKGITFHNGKICTAEDVEYSYQKWIQQNRNYNPIVDIQVINAYTFLMKLDKNYRLSELPMPFIVPKETENGNCELIGTGPFKAVETKNELWRLKRYRAYHCDEPFLDEIVVKPYQNPKELEQALRDGQVDMAVGIDVEDERFNVQTEVSKQRYELVFRLNSRLCQNLHFRKAIYYGLDRTAIAKAAGLKNPLFAKGPFDYVFDERSELPPQEPDRERTKKLLNKIPQPVHLSFEVYYDDRRNKRIVNEIIAQLSELGIKAQIVPPPAQAAVILMNTQTTFLESQFWQKNGIANFGGYYNPQVESLLSDLTDTGTDKQSLKNIQSIIRDDFPSVPLFYNEQTVSYVNNLQALENRTISMSKLYDINTWYFEKENWLRKVQIA